MKRIIVVITDESVGVEDRPDDAIVEIRDYRQSALGSSSGWFRWDDEGQLYLPHVFGEEE